MAQRGRMTFQKRQKEIARKDKRRMKEERRVQRKAAGGLEQLEFESQSALELETQEPMEQVQELGNGSSTSGSETPATEASSS